MNLFFNPRKYYRQQQESPALTNEETNDNVAVPSTSQDTLHRFLIKFFCIGF